MAKMKDYVAQLEDELHARQLSEMKTKLHTDQLMNQVKKSH